jgi:hypothetical protein
MANNEERIKRRIDKIKQEINTAYGNNQPVPENLLKERAFLKKQLQGVGESDRIIEAINHPITFAVTKEENLGSPELKIIKNRFKES